MKHLLKFSSLLALTLTSILFTGCDGEDGDPAPGVEEATLAGNIVATFTGSHEGKAFSRTVDYKYAPVGAPYGSIWRYDNYLESHIAEVERSPVPTSRETVGIALYLDDSNPRFETLYVGAYLTIAERKAIFLSALIDERSDDDRTVTDYSFTSATGELKSKYTFTCKAGKFGNVTENDINITVDVHVTLTELLGNF